MSIRSPFSPQSLDALKRSTTSIGLFTFYQELSLDERGTLFSSIVEVILRVENLHVRVELEVRRTHLV